ncbi:MAG TPA: hypothetical protein VJC11_03390 [Patescibacteria group bacterium]|nr:hypothetical protein [Patescibacteria group bacterium]
MGTKVIFENVGKEDHWPASDDHPSHTLYDGTSLKEHCAPGAVPLFDSCKKISSGESWSFTFEKEEVYKFHDHLWPQLSGEITVGIVKKETPQNKNFLSRFVDYVRKIFSTISSFFTGHKEGVALNSGKTNTEMYQALKTRFEKIVLQFDPREAMQTLREESSQNKEVLALCHDVLHIIGHTAYDRYGSFKEAIKYQEDFCNSGYIHGLFESYFRSTSEPLSGLSDQCGDYGANRKTFDLWQCYHGVGHGLMYFTGGDLDESLALCEKNLPEEAAASCQNGVYMEVFNAEILAKEKTFVDATDPFRTCAARDIAKADCYLYAPTYISQTLGKDFPTVLKECDNVEAGYQESCIYGVGSEAIKRNMEGTNGVFALCKQSGSSINQESCVSGAVSMYMNQQGSYAAGEKLCEMAPESYRDICTNAVKSKELFFK